MSSVSNAGHSVVYSPTWPQWDDMTVENSPRILKANAARGLGSEIVFNYSDLQRQCDEQLQQARAEAERIRAEAVRESEEIRRRAVDEGKSTGLREGLANAAEDIDRKSTQLADAQALERLQTTFPAIQEAAEAMRHERDRWLSHWEGAAVGLAVAIAEKIVHRELELNPEIAVDLVRETLDLAGGSPRLLLKMHSQDVELLGPHADNVVQAAARCGEVKIVPDDSISRGGCVIETLHGTIDARVETQLERIMAELVEQSG